MAAMDQQTFNLTLLALPALIQAAPGQHNIVNPQALKDAIDQAKTALATADAAGAAAARLAGGPVQPGSYDGEYINLQGDTVIKPADFTTWINNESLLANFNRNTLLQLPDIAQNNAYTLDELAEGMFTSRNNLNFALSYYPANNNRIKLPNLVTSNVTSASYTTAINTIKNAAAGSGLTSAMVPVVLPGGGAANDIAAITAAVPVTNQGIDEVSRDANLLAPFQPHPTGVRTCVSTRTGRADLSTCPTLSPADATNLTAWGRRMETNTTSWSTPPNFLHYTDIKLAQGATYNDLPSKFQVARTTTDNSAVLIVTCNAAPRGLFSRKRIDPNHTSFIDYDTSNFILPSGWRISRRLYDGMVVYTSPENITQTFFPSGTFHKVSTINRYQERSYLTACAAVALAKLDNGMFAGINQDTKFRAAELFCCIKLAIRIQNSNMVIGGNKIPRLHFKKSYKNNRRTKNKNRNKSKSMSMFKSAKRAFYRTNKRNRTSKKY